MIELENGDLLASAYGHFDSDKFPSEYRATMNKTRSFLLRSAGRSNGATLRPSLQAIMGKKAQVSPC